MIAARPKSVSQEATLIYPGQMYGPGVGVQQATLAAISAQVGRINANANLHYANALRDWGMNAEIDKSLGLPIPPQPPAPRLIQLKITYADVSGSVVTDPSGQDGLHYAWVEQTL